MFNMIQCMCILQTKLHCKSAPFACTVTHFFLHDENFKVYSLSSFRMRSTVLLAIVATLYVTCVTREGVFLLNVQIMSFETCVTQAVTSDGLRGPALHTFKSRLHPFEGAVMSEGGRGRPISPRWRGEETPSC